MTGYRSDELERYKYFLPDSKKQMKEFIAGKLLEEIEGTNWGTGAENKKSR